MIGGDGTLFAETLLTTIADIQKMPMKNPPHPGETIRNDCLESLGLTVTAGAKALGISRKQLSDVVDGKAGISPEMAIRLSKVFGGSARVWYMTQAAYDLARAMKRADEIQLERLWPPQSEEEWTAT